jgi:uncharacterized membrane protein YeaQ/YmgE (transglycosylase-associated protein family)
MTNILISILVGIFAGFVAGRIVRGIDSGIVFNMIVGIIGSVIGGWIFGLFGLTAHNLLGTLAMSIVGAFVLLWLVAVFNKKPDS